MATKALMTVEQFARMNTADNEAYELVDGELIPLPSPTPLHGNIRDRLDSWFETTSTGTPLAGLSPKSIAASMMKASAGRTCPYFSASAGCNWI